jgi:glutamine amidotransferase
MQNITIVNYGMGNINSVKKQMERLAVNVIVSNKSEDILSADKIILPGVGHFEKAMENLQELNLVDVLNDFVLVKKKPTLGICLGMQLMTNFSEEGNVKGLGWFDAEVVKITVDDTLRYKIPHVGWNTIDQKKESDLNVGLNSDSSFYFVHAYKVIAHEVKDILHSTVYSSEFTSAISKDNIFGVQYHPEKSQDIGLQLFRNFIAL